MSLQEAVTLALGARTAPDPRDGATAALALSYAGLMDEAAPAAKYRRHLEVLGRAVTGTTFDDDDPWESLQVIATALAEHTVASDLGPKLLNTLAGLGLTTTARGLQREGGKGAPSIDPLTRLKGERKLRLTNRSAG